MSTTLEWWQRGPVDGVPGVLQPVAHMLLQLRDEVPTVVEALPWPAWNDRPAESAPVVFHVRHIAGVLDRLFTYARGDALSDEQFTALRAEGDRMERDERTALLDALRHRIECCLHELRTVDPATLTDVRYVGRQRLPSTVIGCLVHGAEHGMRHLGQLVVTARMAATSYPR